MIINEEAVIENVKSVLDDNTIFIPDNIRKELEQILKDGYRKQLSKFKQLEDEDVIGPIINDMKHLVDGYYLKNNIVSKINIISISLHKEDGHMHFMLECDIDDNKKIKFDFEDEYCKNHINIIGQKII